MNIRKELALKLKHFNPPNETRALVGFDGYIDVIQKMVFNAVGDNRTYFKEIKQLAGHILAASGKSAQFELRTETVKMGGNAPIMANALGYLGLKNYCVGMLGEHEIHEVFNNMSSNCNLLSIGPSATSNALEFEDGKLILSEVSSFDNLNWDYLQNTNCFQEVLQGMQSSRLLAMVDWSNLPMATQLWESLLHQLENNSGDEKLFFFDLCDPTKKTKEEIIDVLNLIGKFSKIGTSILGLNENEALKVYQAIFGKSSPKSITLAEVGRAIYAELQVDLLLIHPVDYSLVISKNGVIEEKGYRITSPKLLTGGGDNLNAGFCFGLVNDFSLVECLQIGMAVSAVYVKNGKSPTLMEVQEFIEQNAK